MHIFYIKERHHIVETGAFLSEIYDEDGIRTHAERAHWISSPTP